MNKIFFKLVLLLVLVLPLHNVKSQTLEDLFDKHGFEIYQILKNIPNLDLDDEVSNYMQEYSTYFEMSPEIGYIGKIRDQYIVKFESNILKGKSKVSSWKIRVICENKMSVTNSENTEMCGKVLNKPGSVDGVILNLNNNSSENRKTKVKFRAFDKNNNWITSEHVNVTIPPKK